MSPTPSYKKAVSVPQTATADTTLSHAGSIIASLAKNHNQAPPTYETQINSSLSFSIPLGTSPEAPEETFPIPAMVDLPL